MENLVTYVVDTPPTLTAFFHMVYRWLDYGNTGSVGHHDVRRFSN